MRSGYKALTETEGSGTDFHAWNKLWRVKAAPKIRSFLWRCVKGVIPLRSTLRRRRIDIEPQCPLCGNAEETLAQLAFECNVVLDVWAVAGVSSIFTGNLFNPWLENILNTSEEGVCSWYITLLWFVWKTRNDMVWNGKPLLPNDLVNAASSYMDAWNNATTRASRRMSITQPPPTSFLTGKRCFVDAAIFPDKNCAGFGLALLNDDGMVVEAKAGLLQCTLDPYHAEIMACKEALSWIKENGWTDVAVLTDCLNACNILNRASVDRSYTGGIILDCQAIFRSLQGVSISHVSRIMNSLAHNLAKSSRQRMGTKTWVLNPPQCNLDPFDGI